MYMVWEKSSNNINKKEIGEFGFAVFLLKLYSDFSRTS